MNKQIKEQWIDNLTNGKYVQGQGRLCNPENQFCCLGVLSDMYIKAHRSEVRWDAQEDEEPIFMSETTIFEAYYAPEVVLDWAGIEYPEGNATNEVDGHLFNKSAAGIVSKMNDDDAPFRTIAEWIDKNL